MKWYKKQNIFMFFFSISGSNSTSFQNNFLIHCFIWPPLLTAKHATPLSVTLLSGLFHWNDFPASRNWLHSHFSLFLFTQKDRLKSTRSTRRAETKFLNELVSKLLGVCLLFDTWIFDSFIHKVQLQPSQARLLLIGSILFPETQTETD